MRILECMLQDLKDGTIQIEKLNTKFLIDSSNSGEYIETGNILDLLSNNIYDFKQIVDKIKNLQDSSDEYQPLLVWYENLFEELIKSNLINLDDLRYLLSTIDSPRALRDLCDNKPLIKYVLKEFAFDEEIVDKFNAIIESDDWCKENNVRTVFDRIDYSHDLWNKEISKLNELNRYMYAFNLTKEQSSELIELIQNNEIARNNLKEIMSNHLEANYNFESLMGYLTKLERKNILNI